MAAKGDTFAKNQFLSGMILQAQGHTPAVALASRAPRLAVEMAFLAEKVVERNGKS